MFRIAPPISSRTCPPEKNVPRRKQTRKGVLCSALRHVGAPCLPHELPFLCCLSFLFLSVRLPLAGPARRDIDTAVLLVSFLFFKSQKREKSWKAAQKSHWLVRKRGDAGQNAEKSDRGGGVPTIHHLQPLFCSVLGSISDLPSLLSSLSSLTHVSEPIDYVRIMHAAWHVYCIVGRCDMYIKVKRARLVH